MIFLLVLCLTPVLGVSSEDDCIPECSRELDFVVGMVKLQTALKQLDDGLPPNEFFQENCDFLVEFLRCYRQGCGLRHVVVDLDAVVEVATEFCNEDSSLRKAYVDNIACFSRIEFTEDACISSALRTTEAQIFNYEIRESLEKNSVDRLCLFFYFLMTCAVDITTATCGKRAGRAAAEIMNRAMDIVLCNPDGMDIFNGIFDFFEASGRAFQCNSTRAACAGKDEIMGIIEAQEEFPSEYNLQKYCGQFKEALKCPAEKAKECDETGTIKNVEEYEELLEALNDVCEESSPFRATYLRNVPCYNRILDKFSACSYDIKADVNHFMMSQEYYSPLPFGIKASLKYICMTADLIPNCQIRKTADSCGKEAARTLGRLLLSLQKLHLSMSCKKPHLAIWRDEYFTYLMNGKGEC